MSPYSAAVYDDSDFGRSLHGQVLGCLANDGIRLVLPCLVDAGSQWR